MAAGPAWAAQWPPGPCKGRVLLRGDRMMLHGDHKGVQKWTKGLKNGAKMEVWDPPELVLNGNLARNGDMCYLHTICYVSATSAGPGNHNFGIVLASKSRENRVPDRHPRTST